MSVTGFEPMDPRCIRT